MHLSELWCADDYYDMAHQLLSEKVHRLTNKMPFGCKIIQIHASTYYVTNLKSFNSKFSIYEYIQNNNFMQYKWRGIKSLTYCGLTLTFFDSLRSIGVSHVICSDQSPPPLPHLKCDSVYQLGARLVEVNCGEKETGGSIVNLVIAPDQKILIKPNAWLSRASQSNSESCLLRRL